MNHSDSFFTKSISPWIQAALVFAAIIVFTMAAKLTQALNIMAESPKFPWKTSSALLLLFAIFNSLLSTRAQDKFKYWRASIISFILLVILSASFAYWSSSLSIQEAGSYRFIYIVVGFGYMVFTVIISTVSKIMEYVEKEEWQHPRIRKNKHKKK